VDTVFGARYRTAITVANNNTGTTLEDVAGAAVVTEAGRTYVFRLDVPIGTDLATSGVQFAFKAAGAPAGTLLFGQDYWSSAGAWTSATPVSAFGTKTAATSAIATHSTRCVIWGRFVATGAGTLQLQYASEGAADQAQISAGIWEVWDRAT
jgi:hypothetical protein